MREIMKKRRTKMMSEYIEQVGGNHYKNNIQPWDIIASYKFNWFQGEILKYVCRFKHKGCEQDLDKAITICEKAYKEGIKGCSREKFTNLGFLIQYIEEYTIYKPGDILEYLQSIIDYVIKGSYMRAAEEIRELKDKIYGKKI